MSNVHLNEKNETAPEKNAQVFRGSGFEVSGGKSKHQWIAVQWLRVWSWSR